MPQRRKEFERSKIIVFAGLAVLTGFGAAYGQNPPAEFTGPTYAERLGWPPGSRVVIFHVDDAGMSHDSNMGMLDAMTKGVATSTSVMYPCPWVPEFAKILKEHPDLDAGVHITLTSEWGKYRWGPVAGKKAVPGLVDEEGCLWHDVHQVIFKATPDEVETEIRAQIDRALTMGIKPTHLDSHMGTIFDSIPFFERYLKVGIETGIPVLVPGGHLTYIARKTPFMIPTARQMAKKAWDGGLPVIDDIHTGDHDCKGPEQKKEQIINFLKTVKPGITEFIVHCTRPTEIFQFISGSGPMRFAELEEMMDPDVKKTVEEQKIILTTWRELKQRRDQVKEKEPAQPKP